MLRAVVASRRELYVVCYYFVSLSVPIAMIVGIVWAMPPIRRNNGRY